MRAIWIFLLFITLPSLAVRAAILYANRSKNWSLFFPHLTGICQDFFIAFEQLYLFVLVKYLFPAAHPYLFWVFIIFSSLLQLHMIFDAFLHLKTAIRMEISFFSFINDARCFWDSAKEKKIFRFIPAALLFIAIPAMAYWIHWDALLSLTFSPVWVTIGLLFGLFGTLGVVFLPKKTSYAIDNIIFQHEVWVIQKLYRLLQRKNDQTALKYLIDPFFKPKNEKKSYPSSEYPLFKYTHGFTGEKQFTISIKKEENPHVIFLFMESFRSSNVGCLGSKQGVTPHFDQLAKEGILFSEFYSNSVRTSRSVVSSLYGVPSDMDGSESSQRITVPFIGIPDLLCDAGYKTAYLHNGPIHFENQDVFFKRHQYKTVLGHDDILKKFPRASSTSWGLPDQFLMHYAADYLEQNRDEPQFLTLFTISNHHPWNLPTHYQLPALPPHIPRLHRKYLNTFHYSDACLGLFIDLLQEKKLLENTILFILGDHGYPMGEHDGNFIEQRYLYEENIKVPLLIYAKGRIEKPKIIPTPATQLDLVPTVMDLLDIHGFNLSVGSSLLRPLEDRTVFFHNPYVFKNFGCRVGKYKFIYTKISHEIELYDLETDPLEKENIAEENPRHAEDYLHRVKNYERLFNRLYGEKSLIPTETYETDDMRALNFSSDPDL